MVGAILGQADVNHQTDREDYEENERQESRKKITITFGSGIEINKKAETNNY
jgi:hypothetical protein